MILCATVLCHSLTELLYMRSSCDFSFNASVFLVFFFKLFFVVNYMPPYHWIFVMAHWINLVLVFMLFQWTERQRPRFTIHVKSGPSIHIFKIWSIVLLKNQKGIAVKTLLNFKNLQSDYSSQRKTIEKISNAKRTIEKNFRKKKKYWNHLETFPVLFWWSW